MPLLWALFIALAPGGAASADLADPSFEQWADLASGRQTSPAFASRSSADLVSEWKGADGKPVQLVVRQPVMPAQPRTVTVAAPPADADARPVLEAALQTLRTRGANVLEIQPGVYTFRSVDPKIQAHWVLDRLADVTIRGPGATFRFTSEAHGIWVQQSQRLRIEGLTLDYRIRATSIGRIEQRAGGRVLVIDGKYPVSEANKIFQIVEFDPGKGTFAPGGQRVMFNPGVVEQPAFIGQQTYRSSQFDRFKLRDGAQFMVLHQWYTGVAVKIDGTRDGSQTEDITLSKVTVNATPGMGVAVTGMKRGLAIVDSVFAPAADGYNAGGPEWDPVHVHLGGGDLLIRGNRFSRHTDDAINISYPVHPVEVVDLAGRTLVLSNSARFIAADDQIAFFDDGGRFLGTGQVAGKPQWLDGSRHRVSFVSLPAGITTKSKARNVTLIVSRFEVSGNVIEDCNCHGILTQIPNGLIAGNSIRRTNKNAIRLLSSLSAWNEGVGSFNVVVRDNAIENTGVDDALDVPWAAISVYGEAGNKMAAQPFNQYIEITGNKMTGLRQGCVTVANSRYVKLARNSCSGQTGSRALPETTVLRSSGVNSD